MTEPPVGWQPTTLGQIGRYLNGRGFKKSEWRDSGRPIIRIQNLTGSGATFNYFQGELDDRYVARPGDLLVSWAATLGAFIWKGPEAAVNQHIFKVESYIDRDFHKYLLDYKLEDLMRHTHGSGMVHITKASFDAIPVSVPPPSEQRRIVDLLEDHLTRLEVGTSLVRRATCAAPVLQTQLVELELAGLKTTARTLADVALLITDGDHNPPKRVPEGVPHVTAKGIRDGLIDLGVGTFVSEEGYAQTSARYKPMAGDVIVTCVGTIGRVAVVPDGSRFSADRNLAAIRLDDSKLLPDFLALWLQTPRVQAYMAAASGSTAQPHLYLRDLRRLDVRVPTLSDQRRILDRVADRSAPVQTSLRLAQIVLERVQPLRRNLLKAAFSGQLTSNSDAREGLPV